MKVVLDTSAVIYLNDFRNFEEILTVPEVVDEVKDKVSSMKLSSLELKIVEPSSESLKEIKKIAGETGDLEKLSGTDIRVLALGNEKKCTIISDDRNVQNVAEKIGTGYLSVFNKKITRMIIWKKFCRNCRKKFDKGESCPSCGQKLSRVSESSRRVK